MEHLPPGTITLRVIPPTPRFQDSPTPVTVVQDKKTDVFLFLRESVGTVEGEVIDEGSRGIAGARVYGYFHASGTMEFVDTDEKGHYRFEGITPGGHFIRASAPGFMTEGKSIEVVGSKPSTCIFSLRKGSITLGGRVEDGGSTGVDSEIYLLRAGIVVMKLNTKKEDGKFLFRDLLPGVYELTIVAPGYAPAGWRGELDGDKSLEFKLEKQVFQPQQSHLPHGMFEGGRPGSQ